jgi:uncharacterized protein (DUF2147 family)
MPDIIKKAMAPASSRVSLFLTFLFAMSFCSGGYGADSPKSLLGRWLTSDRTAIIQMESCGDFVCARIVGIGKFRGDGSPPTDFRGRSQCQLMIMSDLVESISGRWTGHITNPQNGKLYNATVWIDELGQLNMRGYIITPLLGETQVWTRFGGVSSSDCRFRR